MLRPDFCSARTPARGAAGAPARYTRYTYARFRVKASAILPAGKRTTSSAESPQLLNIVVNIIIIIITFAALHLVISVVFHILR